MAAANGFVLTRPDAQYGDSTSAVSSTRVRAQRFPAPAVAQFTVTELGFYAGGVTVSAKLSIFHDDAANACPGAMVAHAETSTIAINGATHQVYHTYSTQPVLSGGGASYWIGHVQAESMSVSRFASSGIGKYLSASSMTWPASENDWHSATSQAADFSYYAVYEELVITSTGVPPKAFAYQRQMRG
jgi:hypothetical protein